MRRLHAIELLDMSEAMQPSDKQEICVASADMCMVLSPEQQMASPCSKVRCQPDMRYLMSVSSGSVVCVMVTHKSAGRNGSRQALCLLAQVLLSWTNHSKWPAASPHTSSSPNLSTPSRRAAT